MPAIFDDDSLEHDIAHLRDAIRTWATAHDIWEECGFTTYLEHVDAEPGDTPVVLILKSCRSFEEALEGHLADEFQDLIGSHGYWFEYQSQGTLYFLPVDGERCQAFAGYFNWHWICSLVQADFADIYEEVYSHFARRPTDLHRLSWRDFEILLARIFQAQGFTTELGPGRADGGVDIRFLQRDPIGDVLTLVQAKKYSPKNRIGLEAVAALHGVANVEDAHRALFVTTSSYQPAAMRFAARTVGKLQLCTSLDVAEWCRTAAHGIVRDKSTLVSAPAVERLLLDARAGVGHRVVHAHDWTHNKFALVVKETKHAALLMQLPRQTVAHDGTGQVGTEIPSFSANARHLIRIESVLRAKRSIDETGRVRYWTGRHLYFPWNGKPKPFGPVD